MNCPKCDTPGIITTTWQVRRPSLSPPTFQSQERCNKCGNVWNTQGEYFHALGRYFEWVIGADELRGAKRSPTT